jgi:AcrR family transcriptional regulator
MPPRPSRNLDRALLAAGRALLPRRGCGGLSVREVAEAANVNLGMFHYHFKSRDAFLRALLQSLYEEMFSALVYHADMRLGPREGLRAAMRFLGRFLRDNRPVLARVMSDALCGEPIAVEFLQKNFPRHLGLMRGMVELGQREGVFAPLPMPQVVGFCAGSLAMPIIFGGAVADLGALGPAGSRGLEAALLSDAAIDQRIDLAIDAITLPRPANAASPAPRPRRPTRKKKASP